MASSSGRHTLRVPIAIKPGSFYQIKIVSTSNANNFVVSGDLSITCEADPEYERWCSGREGSRSYPPPGGGTIHPSQVGCPRK